MRLSSYHRKVAIVSLIAAATLLLNKNLIRLTYDHAYRITQSVAIHTVQPSVRNSTTIIAETPTPVVCTESRSLNFTRYTRYRPLQQLSDFLVGPGLDNDNRTSAAVCEFNYKAGHNWFPHLMQQLYRCWSYWCVAVPFSINDTRKQHKEPVLLYDPKLARGTKRSRFSDGILAALTDAAGVKIVANHSDTYSHNGTVTAKLARNGQVPHFAILPGHGEILTHFIAQHYSLSPGQAGCPQPNSNTAVPRVVILNRKGSRKLLNADIIAHKIQALLPNQTTTIPVVYMETKTFLEQVQVFRDTDILIAPHGAALTGTIFLPPCSHVMEIFPVGYDIPGYFGTLAVYSGHPHGYLILTKTGNIRQEHADAKKSVAAHTKAREVQLCPPSETIVDAVQKMITAWRKCCNDKHEAARYDLDYRY